MERMAKGLALPTTEINTQRIKDGMQVLSNGDALVNMPSATRVLDKINLGIQTVLCVFTSVLYDTGSSCQWRKTGKRLRGKNLPLPLSLVLRHHLHLKPREKQEVEARIC